MLFFVWWNDVEWGKVIVDVDVKLSLFFVFVFCWNFFFFLGKVLNVVDVCFYCKVFIEKFVDSVSFCWRFDDD